MKYCSINSRYIAKVICNNSLWELDLVTQISKRKLRESVHVLTGPLTDLLVDEFEVAPVPKPKETEAQPEPEVSGEENREEGKTTCCLFSLNLSLPHCQESYDFKEKKILQFIKTRIHVW